MKHSYSAGGVVLNPEGNVLVVSQNGDSWSLPKGHIDPGENALIAAKREIVEESGITNLVLVRELEEYQRYRIGPGGHGEDTSDLKTIVMFLFTTTQMELRPTDPHHPEARWVERDLVAEMLTHPKDQNFFRKVRGLLPLTDSR